ncbi:MAG: DNA polymerase III subunit beta [Candidatus Omnitrophica bacterium]|nr:DNA polymerase III subunit beta [Candidatus Omnitrophota bacterium]
MEIQAQKTELVNALSLIIGGVSAKTTLPILSNILIETTGADSLEFTATDLEISLSTKATAKVIKEGAITVPARKFYEIVRELEGGEVLITVAKNNAVNIRTEKTHCRIVGLRKEDFPKRPTINAEESIELEQKTLKDCLALTSFAISHDETRYVLNGVLIVVDQSKIKFAATDGRRLAYIEKELEVNTQKHIEIIIPTKTVAELNKILSVGKLKITTSQNQVAFQTDRTLLISRLIEGRFPNYEQVIPKEEKTTTIVNKQSFLAAVKRAALFTSQEAQAVKFDFVKDKILISAHSPNLGEVKEEVEAKVTGDDLSIGFNPSYLMDALKSLGDESISFSLSKSDKPGLLKAEGNYLYVIMPMQVS